VSRLAPFASPYWIGGIVLGAVGVVVARVVGPAASGAGQPLLKLAGELIAVAGVLLIAFGVSRRVNRRPPS